MSERDGDAEGLRREVERVADRLRVVGPRLAAQQDTVAAAGRLAAVREVLQRLADLTADLEGGPRRRVPVLAPHALADQVLVLGNDLLAACAARAEDGQAGEQLLAQLRREL